MGSSRVKTHSLRWCSISLSLALNTFCCNKPANVPQSQGPPLPHQDPSPPKTNYSHAQPGWVSFVFSLPEDSGRVPVHTHTHTHIVRIEDTPGKTQSVALVACCADQWFVGAPPPARRAEPARSPPAGTAPSASPPPSCANRRGGRQSRVWALVHTIRTNTRHGRLTRRGTIF